MGPQKIIEEQNFGSSIVDAMVFQASNPNTRVYVLVFPSPCMCFVFFITIFVFCLSVVNPQFVNKN